MDVKYCTEKSLISEERREVDLAVVSSVSACRSVKKTIGEVPMVFLSNNRKMSKVAFNEGCIDFMLNTETHQLLTRLKMYARIANIHHLIKKVENYTC